MTGKTIAQCPKCRGRVTGGAGFCGFCGTALKGVEISERELGLTLKTISTRGIFFGRKKTLQLIPGLAREAINNQGRILYLHGPAGGGKTAFMRQLIPFFELNGFRVADLSGEPECAYLTLHTLTRLVADLAGIQDSTPRLKLPSLSVALGKYNLPSIDKYYLSLLFPFDLPQTTNQRLDDQTRLTGMISAVIHLIQSLSRQKPLALLIDHLQWSDRFTKRAVRTLERIVANERIFAIIATREPDADTTVREQVRHATLDGLSLRHTISLSRRHLDAKMLPPELEERLLSATGGIPLAVLLLTDYLVEKEYLTNRGGGWRINDKLRSLEFPLGVTEIMTARLEMLKPHIAELLRMISVLSTECTFAALKAIYPHAKYLRDDLDELARRHLIDLIGEDDHARIRFKDSYVREYIYGSIPVSGLSDLHSKVAEFLQKHPAVCAYEKNWRIVYHMTFSPESDEDTIHRIERSGDALSGRLHFLLAALCYQREAQILRRNIKKATRNTYILQHKLLVVLGKLARVYLAIGDTNRAEKTHRMVISLSHSLGAPFMAIDTLIKLGGVYAGMDKGAEAEGAYEKALLLAREQADPCVISRASYELGELFRLRGIYDRAIIYLNEAISLASELEKGVQPAKVLSPPISSALGACCIDTSDLDHALPYLIEAMDKSFLSRNVTQLILVMEYLSYYYSYRNDHEKALAFLNLGLRIARAVGDRMSVATLSFRAARSLMLMNKIREAESAFLDALDLCREMDSEEGIERSLKALKLLRENGYVTL